MKKYQITVTEKQLQTIGLACEMYGSVQYGQGHMIASEVPFKEFSDKWDFEERLRKLLGEYDMEYPERQHDCDIAFDMWRKITRKDDFTMGSEPTIDVEEIFIADKFDRS